MTEQATDKTNDGQISQNGLSLWNFLKFQFLSFKFLWDAANSIHILMNELRLIKNSFE